MTEGQLNNCNEHSTLDEQAGQTPLKGVCTQTVMSPNER